MHNSNKNLGGRDLDWLILQKVSEEFKSEHNIDLMDLPKCRITLTNAIEKARNALTADTEAFIQVDYITE